MALYSIGQFEENESFLIMIADFAESNGWTKNVETTYEGNYRCHISKGDAHFELWHSGTLGKIYITPCTGYVDMAGPHGQTNPAIDVQFAEMEIGGTVALVSSGECIYIGYSDAENEIPWTWGVAGIVSVRYGGWTGGQICSGWNSPGVAQIYSYNGYQTSRMQLFKDGYWTPLSAYGCVSGSSNQETGVIIGPNEYNLSIIPIKILLFIHDSLGATPIGSAPNVMISSVGDVHGDFDTVAISGENWLVCPNMSQNCGSMDLLIKII